MIKLKNIKKNDKLPACAYFRSNEDIIQLIKDGEHDVIGAEKLRGLLKILPEKDEIEMLKTFDGDKLRLGNAEKFLMLFSHVPK